MKHIVIKSCSDCPHKDHSGAYGAVGYIPVCDKANRKKLGYTVQTETRGNRQINHAVYDGKIPTFCPLEDYK